MLDNYKRNINYLRVSLTNNCNLNCFYCSKPENSISENKNLGFDEIIKVVNEASLIGFSKVRLTGGEPLLVENIESLINAISKINGINEICLTTNGTMLADKAERLKESGLSRINISLDTLNRETFKLITGYDEIDSVLAGIHEATRQKIRTKVNMVVLKGINEDEISDMKDFCNEINAELQLIERFDIATAKTNFCKYHRPPNCETCNRIRLLANGVIKPCLHSDIEYNLDFSDIKKSLKTAIINKPENGSRNLSRTMAEIGG